MNTRWQQPGWQRRSAAELDEALDAVGLSRTAPLRQEKAWGRSCIQRTMTTDGEVWIKHGYGLPPGEDVVLTELTSRWGDRLPVVVTTWPGSVVLRPLPGEELTPDDPVEAWTDVARSLGEFLAGEASQAPRWLAAGVRDRRPAAFGIAVRALLGSEVAASLSAEVRSRFTRMVPDLIARYDDAFDGLLTLVPQDSGCCNVHITAEGPVFFDWADVVVGHPVFSGDRFLDQVVAERRPSVIAAFVEPLGLPVARFHALRRSNVLHEILRYHDELEYVASEDGVHVALAESVRSQIGVLVSQNV